MKKILITILLVLTFLIVFWSVEYYQKDNVVVLNIKNISMLDVYENSMSCTIFNAEHFNSWNYKYDISDRNLYITVYSLSALNPMAQHGWLDVKIDEGYNEFDNIYIDNGVSAEPIVIWKSENIFTEDKLSDLNVTSNEFSCRLNYENWGYNYKVSNRVLYLEIYEKDEKNENGLEVKVDKGYDNFDEVRIFSLDKDIVIWSKTE